MTPKSNAGVPATGSAKSKVRISQPPATVVLASVSTDASLSTSQQSQFSQSFGKGDRDMRTPGRTWVFADSLAKKLTADQKASLIARTAAKDGDLFRGAGEVADDQFFLWEAQMEQRLEVAVEAHAFAGAVADDGDAFALDEFQWQLARGQIGLLGTRTGLQDFVDLLLREHGGGCEGREQGGQYEEAEGHARGSGGCLAFKVARRGGKVNGGPGHL